jgi:hypothetical protein
MDATMHLMAREVQRAVMTAPTASVGKAVETARGRRSGIGEWLAGRLGGAAIPRPI